MKSILADKALTIGGFTGLCIGLLFLVAAQMGVEGFGSGGGGVLPTGAIVMTLNGTCPALYVESAQFRGRTAVGMPAGGTIGGTAGTAMSNLEARLPVISGAGGTIATGLGSTGFTSCVGCATLATTSGATLDATAPNTEPALPYVQVLYCVKS